jgi:putative PIN family toxin of toxin-antitoxin system
VGKKLSVVVDTSVLISAFVFGGIPRKTLLTLLQKAEIYVSPIILDEYRDVPLTLEEEGKISHDQLKVLLGAIAAFVSNAKIIYPNKTLLVCRDKEDNMLLECCFAAKADYLITGDKDLLDINPDTLKTAGLSNLQILNPRDFSAELNKSNI